MKTVITLYRPAREGFVDPGFKSGKLATVAMCGFVIANVLVGMMAHPIAEAIRTGLSMFS